MKYIDHNHIPTDRRPLGYWLRAIEGPLRENMRNAFATFGVTRREWRTLTTLHTAPSTVAELAVALPPRRGKPRPEHGPHGARTFEQLLESFVNRGWAQRSSDAVDRGTYALTAEGERIHDAVLANVQKVRAQVSAGIPEADYATTMSALAKIAGNVGFDPTSRPARGRGHRGHRRNA